MNDDFCFQPEALVEALQREAARLLLEDESSEAAEIEAAKRASRMLSSLLAQAIRSAHIKGNGEVTPCSPLLRQFRQVEVRFDRIPARITLGIYLDEIYLSVDLVPAEHIRDMGDEFWSEILGLRECGTVSFSANKPMGGDGTVTDRGLQKKNKSLVFVLIRDCILLEQEEARYGTRELSDVYMDFGHLEIKWCIDTPAAEVAKGLYAAVRRCHRIAYLLYRAGYLSAHSRAQRANGP